jgi:hypothetical protein
MKIRGEKVSGARYQEAGPKIRSPGSKRHSDGQSEIPKSRARTGIAMVGNLTPEE